MALAEGEVGTGAGGIDYATVTTCLTITCLLDDASNTHVGGHASLMTVEGKLPSNEILDSMVGLVAGRTVLKAHLAGVLPQWNPLYLTENTYYKPNGETNYSHEVVDCADDVAGAFGIDASAVTSEDREGPFRIALTPGAPAEPVRESKEIDRATLISEAWTSDGTPIADDTELEETSAISGPDGALWVIMSIDSDNFTLQKF